MTITTDGIIHRIAKDKILYKVVNAERNSAIPVAWRNAQLKNSYSRGDIKNYSFGIPVFSSLEYTAGLYCFLTYDDANNFKNDGMRNANWFIIQVKVVEDTKYYTGTVRFRGEEVPTYCVEALEVIS